MSTFTTAKDLELVPRGADVGTWDTPTNSNWSIVDAALGGVATIDMSAGSIVLAPSQYQCSQLVLINALPSNASVTLPTTFTGFYTVQNMTTNSSLFSVTLRTTAGSSAQIIGCPPSEPFDCINDGFNIKYRNLGRIGVYEDYAGSSLPNWVTVSAPQQPYLLCDGSSFSSAAYPALANILGTTVLPDGRGRVRYMLNLGTGRTVIINSRGLDGNTIFAQGGQNIIDGQVLPSYDLPYTDPAHVHGTVIPNGVTAAGQAGGPNAAGIPFNTQTNANQVGITIHSAGGGSAFAPNSYVGGITMVRAA